MHPDSTIPPGFCQCGCGERAPIAKANHARSGHVKGQPVRFIKGHGSRRTPVRWIVKDAGYDTPCWLWQWNTTWDGYGTMRAGGKIVYAHRYYYIQKFGDIPPGMQLDHLCRNRRCVNPDHLEPVTHRVNAQRGANTHLTPDDIIEIRALQGVVRQKDLALRYGVHRDTILRIWLREKWANI